MGRSVLFAVLAAGGLLLGALGVTTGVSRWKDLLMLVFWLGALLALWGVASVHLAH